MLIANDAARGLSLPPPTLIGSAHGIAHAKGERDMYARRPNPRLRYAREATNLDGRTGRANAFCPFYLSQAIKRVSVNAYVAPAPDTLALVTSYLSSHGLTATPYTPAGDVLTITATTAQARALFGAEYGVFEAESGGKETVRTLKYDIPAGLKGSLEFVHPTVMFPQKLARPPVVSVPIPKSALGANANLTADAAPAACADVMTPACLQALYGIPTTPATESANTIAVSGFIEQYANEADLATFLAALRPDIPSNTTFTLQTLDGGVNPQDIADAGIEADLDTQYTIGIATGVPVAFVSVGEDQEDDIFGFMDIVNFFLAEDNPPNVFTTSYGSDEEGISQSVATNLCNAYMQLGARGTSIFFSSGDGGVSGSQSSTCVTFVPTFPSGCPFLTSVGATQDVNPEIAADFSSGGFSNLFAQPSYQSAAVSSYLDTLGLTNLGLYNPSGRGFPDVSAAGENVEIVWQGQTGLVAGTSCSSPIFASVVALLNDELIGAGKSPLGFLNPFLYSTGAGALTDVTSGSNPGCFTDGFPASSGWDPVTGLGTPNYAALRTAVGL